MTYVGTSEQYCLAYVRDSSQERTKPRLMSTSRERIMTNDRQTHSRRAELADIFHSFSIRQPNRDAIMKVLVLVICLDPKTRNIASLRHKLTIRVHADFENSLKHCMSRS
jgi:hypothetical protein